MFFSSIIETFLLSFIIGERMDTSKIIFSLISDRLMKPVNGFVYAVGIKDLALMKDLAKKYASQFRADKAFGCLLRSRMFEHHSILTDQGLRLSDCSSTIIYDLIDEGELQTLAQLIKKAPEMLDKKNGDGMTPLCNSVESDQEDEVKILLDCGAKATGHLSHDMMPIFFAKDVDIAKLLLTTDPQKQLHAKTPQGDSLLDHLYDETYDLSDVHDICKLFLQLGVAFRDDTRRAFIESDFAFDECLNDHEEIQKTRREIFLDESFPTQILPELKNQRKHRIDFDEPLPPKLPCKAQRLTSLRQIPSEECILIED